jgi:hypothetical protein
MCDSQPDGATQQRLDDLTAFVQGEASAIYSEETDLARRL